MRSFSQIRLAPIFVLFLALASCRSEQKPSILIIAVDRLPFSLSLCARESSALTSGFHRLCTESVRFTHAISPSLMSAPALTSLLTSLYPIDHGVHHSGRPGLSSAHTTVGEAALRAGYRTSFFSGGAPILRRSGLHQGFEHFDDNFVQGQNKIYRTFKESAEHFWSWWTNESDEEPFLSVFYVPDLALQSLTRRVETEFVEPRENASLDDIDETLHDIFEKLRANDTWNSTYIIVAGLNGQSPVVRQASDEYSILSNDLLQVELFIKPAQRPRDAAIHWKIDRHVSLADVGATIFQILKAPVPRSAAGVSRTDLLDIITSNRTEPHEPKILPVETAWPEWMGLGPRRLGAFYEHQLIWLSKPPVVFNTLVDRTEMISSPLPKSLNFVIEELGPHQGDEWSSKERVQTDQTPWRAQEAIEKRDWTLLEKLALQKDQSLWLFIAQKNLGKSVNTDDPCVEVIVEQKWSAAKLCQDENLSQLIHYLKSPAEEKEYHRRRLARLIEDQQWSLHVARQNARLGYPWLPASADANVPSALTLALALPELRRLSW